jgi:hypothetical protein
VGGRCEGRDAAVVRAKVKRLLRAEQRTECDPGTELDMAWSALLLPRKRHERRAGRPICSSVTAIRRRHKEEGFVRMISNGRAVVVAVILGSVAAAGCSKKDNYAADTTAVSTPAVDSTTTTASSTTTMTPDTAAKTMAAAPAPKKTSTKKKAPTKTTY